MIELIKDSEAKDACEKIVVQQDSIIVEKDSTNSRLKLALASSADVVNERTDQVNEMYLKWNDAESRVDSKNAVIKVLSIVSTALLIGVVIK